MALNTLKNAQQDAVNIVAEKISRGNNRLLLSMATGTGKTAVIINVINNYLKTKSFRLDRVLVVLSTRTLLFQLQDVFKSAFEDITVSVDINEKAFKSSSVVLTTTTNLTSIDQLRSEFGLIIIDDYESSGFGNKDSFLPKLLASQKSSIQLAFSSIQKSSDYFGESIFTYSYKSAVQDGVLVPFKVKRISFQNFSEFNPMFFEGEIGLPPISLPELMLERIVKSIIKQINDEKTIVFCPSIEVAHRIAKLLNEITNSNYCEEITSSINPTDINNRLSLFRTDDTNPMVISTVDILFSGTLPSVKNIVILRRTKSVAILSKMLGIGLRHYPGKDLLNVIDYVGLDSLFQELDDTELEIIIENEATDDENSNATISKADILFRDKRNISGVLEVDDLAAELAEIIRIIPPEQGAMLGIFGKWGRGKTFLMQETWKALDIDDTFIKVDFHAWKYQDTPATWAYLYECLSEKYFEVKKRNIIFDWIERQKKLFLLNWERKGIVPLLKFCSIILLGVFVISLSTFFLSVKVHLFLGITGIFFSVSTTLYALFKSIHKEYGAKAKDLFLKYSNKHSFKEHLGLQAEIQKETIKLLKVWIPDSKKGKRKVVLFVEDIDRCSEDKIIQIIDSLRVLLDELQIAERVVIVAAIDESILKLAIKMKYHSLLLVDLKENEHRMALNRVTNEYIDKLFIAGIKLGDISIDDRDEFLKELTKRDRIKDDLADLSELLKNGKEFKQPKPIPNQQALYDQLEYEAELNGNISFDPDEIQYLSGSEEMVDKPKTTSKLSLDNKLTVVEMEILRITLTEYIGATPRQIRIFYYRYLVAKNLLIRRYDKLKRTNIWLTPKHCSILASLIIGYSLEDDPRILSRHKIEVMQSKGETSNVFLLSNIAVNVRDYKELLKILDIVIAY